MAHPESTFESAQLFTAGSYGVDIYRGGDGLRNAPRQGWCQLAVLREAVITSIAFGSDVSGGDKIIGQTLPVGIYLWARILSIEASGVIELRRGRFNPEGAVAPTNRIEVPFQVEYGDGFTLLSWTTPPQDPNNEYQIWRDGVLLATVASGARSYADITAGQANVYQVFLIL